MNTIVCCFNLNQKSKNFLPFSYILVLAKDYQVADVFYLNNLILTGHRILSGT